MLVVLVPLFLIQWAITRNDLPDPGALERPLAAGGRVAGVQNTPLMVDVTGDGIEEVVFWRTPPHSLVAMHASTGAFVWESESFGSTSRDAWAWAAGPGLLVADSAGFLHGMSLESGARRFRIALGASASSLCRQTDELLVTTADSQTVAIDPVTGRNLGRRPSPSAAQRLTECHPISGDRFPDQGHAKAWTSGEWSGWTEGDATLRRLLPEPWPEGLGANSYFYLPREQRWLIAGHRSPGSFVPMLGYTGTRAAPFSLPWSQSPTGDNPLSAEGVPLVAVTTGRAFATFALRESGLARAAAFDLPSGQRRWERQVGPRDLSAIAASEHHVVLTWVFGLLPQGSAGEAIELLVLDAATGEVTAQIANGTSR
jgi:hypothetical protein